MVMYDQKVVKYAENTWKWGFEWGTKQLFFYYSQNFVLIVFIFLVKQNDLSIQISKEQVLKK